MRLKIKEYPGDKTGVVMIADEKNCPIALQVNREHAEFICKVINSHEALIEMLTDEEEIQNTPCKKCGDIETELHLNGLCGNCYEL